jgi:hypothetical protein
MHFTRHAGKCHTSGFEQNAKSGLRQECLCARIHLKAARQFLNYALALMNEKRFENTRLQSPKNVVNILTVLYLYCTIQYTDILTVQ